jgi:peptidoglycan hydrolase-like protein with peptidoglycan-binding domain
VDGQSATYTGLPAVGETVGRGETLYEISGQPVVMLYGSVAPWRAFMPGMSPGRDVAELNANLAALGYGAPSGNAFTAATASAVDRFQSARGISRTGRLLLGSVVFEPGAVRVTSVTPTLGASVQAGPVLGITSTARQVTIELEAAQQSEVEVGDPVTITLPDNSTTPGKVSYVGSVATSPPSSDQAGGGGSSTPTIEVDVTPTHAAATGHLDQAPVDVSITTATVKDAIVVPVNALLALGSGGYAVEAVAAGGAHHLVRVQLGLFDDADGLVQITGSGLSPGRRVVVPSQ